MLTSRVVREGTARVLETTWTSGQTGETLASVRAPVTPSSFPPRFAWEETPELERKFPSMGRCALSRSATSTATGGPS